VRAWHPSRRCSTMARTTRRPTHCPGREARGRTLRFHPVRLSTKGRSLSRFTLDRRLEAEASRRFTRIPAWSRSSVAVHLGSLLWPRPLQFSDGLLLRPKPFAALRWIPVPAEAVAVLLKDRCFDRSLYNVPFGVPIGPKSFQVSRIPAWAEALAVHRSVPRVRPKPRRFTCPESPCRPKPIGIFRPARMSAEAGSLPGLAPRQSRSLGGSPPKRRAGQSRSVSPVWIPLGPKPFQFSFGGPVKPELRVPPGCSTMLADLAKAKGKPVASAWRRLRQPPSP
jgi:hypothetical protein